MPAENLLTINELQLHANSKQIVHDLSFSIKPGETLALVGESGSGKTLSALSILKILPSAVQLSRKTQILFDGSNLRLLPEYLMRTIRGKRVTMIFQEPMLALNPVLTIKQQLSETLTRHTNLNTKQRTAKMLALLDAVGLDQAGDLLEAYPHQLSGGMRQRVMIAMALATEPDLLIADEPTTALDVTVQAQILDLLKSLQKKYQLAMLFITHDLAVVKKIADRVAVLYQGHLLETAPAEAFFSNANHPYSEMLFNALPSIKQRNYFLPVSDNIQLETTHATCPFLSRCQYRQTRCQIEKPNWIQRTPTHQYLCHFERLAKTTPQSKEAIAPKKSDASVLITFDDLIKYYPIKRKFFTSKEKPSPILKGVSGAIYGAQTLALVGESGSGKTTLAKVLIGLEGISSGKINYLNLAKHDIQMIFQDPHSAMNPRWTIRDILSEGLKARQWQSRLSDQYLSDLLQQVGLSGDCLNRYPHAFSGGQKQRIVIARALAVQPKLIICDEPTSALDVSVQAQLLNLLKQLQIKTQIAYLFISHNITLVSYLADKIMVMQKGQIVEQGDAITVLSDPQHPYTQTLLASVPAL